MSLPLFYITRHGKTAGNENNVYRGWSNADFAQLDAAGRDDAREAGVWMQKAGLSFPIAISDDLDRCIESKQIICDILGIKEQLIDKRLRPINVGDFTGKNKKQNPLTKYMEDKSLRIPGGESLNQFNLRQSSFFDDVMQTIIQIKKPILIVGHGSNASFLHNFNNKGEGKVGYEGITNPGGVSMFTRDGIIPLLKKREAGISQPYKDGTALAGFVTDEENRPPRECWNCKWFVRDKLGLGACRHPLVQIDPQLQNRKQADGLISVGDRDCCDEFQNHIST